MEGVSRGRSDAYYDHNEYRVTIMQGIEFHEGYTFESALRSIEDCYVSSELRPILIFDFDGVILEPWSNIPSVCSQIPVISYIASRWIQDELNPRILRLQKLQREKFIVCIATNRSNGVGNLMYPNSMIQEIFSGSRIPYYGGLDKQNPLFQLPYKFVQFLTEGDLENRGLVYVTDGLKRLELIFLKKIIEQTGTMPHMEVYKL